MDCRNESPERAGIKIEKKSIDQSEKVKGLIDLDSIREREVVTKHDVKARLEEFAEFAGHQHAHKGMTSRDLTENVGAIAESSCSWHYS